MYSKYQYLYIRLYPSTVHVSAYQSICIAVNLC